MNRRGILKLLVAAPAAAAAVKAMAKVEPEQPKPIESRAGERPLYLHQCYASTSPPHWWRLPHETTNEYILRMGGRQ